MDILLSSGLHSPKYIQCAKLLSYPHLAKNICLSLSNKLKKNYKKKWLLEFRYVFCEERLNSK